MNTILILILASLVVTGTYFYNKKRTDAKMQEQVNLWFDAAIQGDVDAYFNLGQLYQMTGEAEKAALRFILAANQGHVGAMYNLGRIYFDKASKELTQYEHLSENDRLQKASNHLDLEQGNLKTALDFFILAADKGHLDAQKTLGVIFEIIGETEFSLKYFGLAAEQNDPIALEKLKGFIEKQKNV